ncbi:hypothetical protein XENOCAPTIV_004934 [Xenoophorus captivus]|uniref:Uncharacterized protein n=1 Tax=Xenoophorus captivus TaxID=1517983 RepID=A0ABV0RNU9_9TELE
MTRDHGAETVYDAPQHNPDWTTYTRSCFLLGPGAQSNLFLSFSSPHIPPPGTVDNLTSLLILTRTNNPHREDFNIKMDQRWPKIHVM